MGFGGVEHSDFKTVLQRSQLFERFRELQRRRFELCERSQHSSLVAVEAYMTLGPGERLTRKIESRSIESRNHFHNVARAELTTLEGTGERRHVGPPEGLDNRVDRLGLDQRLVALNVDDRIEL